MRRRARYLNSALAVAVAAMALLVPAASAEVEIGSLGSGAGQVESPRGVAVDHSSGLLYVADGGNNRIDVFNADTGTFVRAFGWGVADGTTTALQTCTTTCFKGLAGSGTGQFKEITGVAVDDDPASPGFHDIYVFENGNRRVQRFSAAGDFVWMVGGEVNKTTNADLCTAASGDLCGVGIAGDAAGSLNIVERGGVAVGPGGIVYIADQVGDSSTRKSRVQKYEPSGAFAGQLLLEVAGGSGFQTGVAVDSGSNFYIGTNDTTGAVRKYSPTGVELFKVDPSFNVNAVAVNQADNLFVSDNSEVNSVLEFTSLGVQARTFYGSLSLAQRAFGLAPYNASEIFTAESGSATASGVVKTPFPPAGPIVHPASFLTAASPIGNTKATLNAKVNSEGKATTFHFQYITDAAYQAAGNSFGAGTVSTAETALPGPADFALHSASAGVTGLIPETLYHLQAVASNADGANRLGSESTFTTKKPVELGAIWSTEVGTDAALLHAEANPLGIPAIGRFEYVEQASFEASGYDTAVKAPAEGAAAINFGAGEASKEGKAVAYPLKAGTTYRYRLIATDHCKPEPEPLCNFISDEGTFTTFEAPIGPAPCINDSFRIGTGAALPDCRGYEMVSPVEKNGADVDALANLNGFYAGIEQAAADGQSITYSTYKAFGSVASAPYVNQYLGRRDEDKGWLTEAISPKRQGPALMTHQSAALERQYKAFGPDLCDSWVVQDADPILAPGGIAGFPGLYRRDNCGSGSGSYEALTTVEPPNLLPEKFIPELQGSSGDGSVALVSVDDNLTVDAPPQPGSCLSTQLDCLSRLYEVREGQPRLVCILPGETPYAGGCGAGTPRGFASGSVERAGALANAISDDGSRIFWSASAFGPGKLYVRIDGTETVEISTATSTEFWTAAADGSKAIYTVGTNLFSFDVASKAPTLIAEGVSGVAGASEDASRIYFSSSKELVPGEGEAGKPNLYLYEEGSGFEFIATLADVDVVVGTPSVVAGFPNRRISRVTPDGQQIAFMSQGSLTGYDNTDAVSKKADAEVFLYDATANGGAGDLRCVSCNPSGARPVGRPLTQKLLEGYWAAARIPTWQSQLHGSRVLSDDGDRLYFNSFEALVAHDANGQEDVYQWEAPGSGSCTEESPSYSPPNGGCVDLISSGESPKGSELVDIGADGNDVFFKTSQSLVKQDPGLIDIYDARTGGGFPPPPTPPAACEGEACAPAAVAPGDPTPSSSSFRGPGDAVGQGASRKACPKGKRKVRKAGKQRCVKSKRTTEQTKKRHQRRETR